jgi:hypothetical protein
MTEWKWKRIKQRGRYQAKSYIQSLPGLYSNREQVKIESWGWVVAGFDDA